MTRQLDLVFLEAAALRRIRRGAMTQRDGQWLYRGRPIPDGVQRELYAVLADHGLLQLADADEHGLRRISLTENGEQRYLHLVQAQPTPLPVPAPDQLTGTGTGAGERRGWCVAGCGCSLEVPPGGAVYVDCPACAPASAEAPAGHRPLVAVPPETTEDRPDPADADTGPEGRRPVPVRVGRRSEQIIGRERDRIAARLAERYRAGAAIRELAGETGRSFGWIRTLLVEARVQLRTRGGDRRTNRGPETGR